MADSSGLIFSGAAITGGASGEWFQVPDRGRTHVPILVNISGTATVLVEGRNGPADSGVEIKTSTASEGYVGAAFPQMRVSVSGATAADVRVSVASSVIQAI